MYSCKQLILSDINRHNISGSGIKKILKQYSVPGCKFMIYWRLAHRLRGGVFKYIVWHYSIKYGYQIPIQTNIGKGLYLGHHGAVVINPGAIIGDNCNIAQNVTIGMENRGERKGCPTIGNKVWIGAGAVIVGKINVGDDVLVAPNTFINRDIPSHSIVFGNPCTIKHRENATEGYIK